MPIIPTVKEIMDKRRAEDDGDMDRLRALVAGELRKRVPATIADSLIPERIRGRLLVEITEAGWVVRSRTDERDGNYIEIDAT